MMSDRGLLAGTLLDTKRLHAIGYLMIKHAKRDWWLAGT